MSFILWKNWHNWYAFFNYKRIWCNLSFLVTVHIIFPSGHFHHCFTSHFLIDHSRQRMFIFTLIIAQKSCLYNMNNYQRLYKKKLTKWRTASFTILSTDRDQESGPIKLSHKNCFGMSFFLLLNSINLKFWQKNQIWEWELKKKHPLQRYRLFSCFIF
jgi:hypothetical protein